MKLFEILDGVVFFIFFKIESPKTTNFIFFSICIFLFKKKDRPNLNRSLLKGPKKE